MNSFPKARRNKLVIQELQDEVLVYDLERDKACCLNETAALVWKSCDGQSDATKIAQQLGEQLQTPVDERVVWFALAQLERDRLLEQAIVPPAAMSGMTRRQMVRTLGFTALVAVPLVTSMVAPSTAQAVSCQASGHACGNDAQCCSNVCSAGNCT